MLSNRALPVAASKDGRPRPKAGSTSMKVAIAGASGFIGSALASSLVDAGHTVTALTRQPDRYSGAGTPVMAHRFAKTLKDALIDHDAAYYLVHSLRVPFRQRSGRAHRSRTRRERGGRRSSIRATWR